MGGYPSPPQGGGARGRISSARGCRALPAVPVGAEGGLRVYTLAPHTRADRHVITRITHVHVPVPSCSGPHLVQEQQLADLLGSVFPARPDNAAWAGP